MKLQIFMKKMNRGIALALLALVILMIYIIFDGIRFNEYKDDIIQMLENYTDECENVYIIDKADYEDGFIKKDKQDKMKSEYIKTVKKYWVDRKDSISNSFGTGKQDLLSGIEKKQTNYGEILDKSNGFIKDAHFKVEANFEEAFLHKNEIKKVGPNLAMIPITLECEYDMVGMPSVTYFSPVNNSYDELVNLYFNKFYKDDDVEKNDKDFSSDMKSKDLSLFHEVKITFERNYDVYVTRKNNKWKIIEINDGAENLDYNGEQTIQLEEINDSLDKKAEDKNLEDKKDEDKNSEDKKDEDKNLEDKKAEDKNLEDKKDEDKNSEDKKDADEKKIDANTNEEKNKDVNTNEEKNKDE